MGFTDEPFIPNKKPFGVREEGFFACSHPFQWIGLDYVITLSAKIATQ
jgi:hypothetical protein